MAARTESASQQIKQRYHYRHHQQQRTWQNESLDLPQRRLMIRAIYHQITRRTPVSHDKKVVMARKLEVLLYQQATSLLEYQDVATIRQRSLEIWNVLSAKKNLQRAAAKNPQSPE